MANAKQAAALKAVERVKDNMTIGLGTGSTAYFAIESLGNRVRDGLRVQAVCSSAATEALAKKAGIPIAAFTTINGVDLYFDGADEVDPSFNLVKGGGGALVREKIVAYNSNVFIVIVDSSKRVQMLGGFPLPVEVVPFAVPLTIQHLQKRGSAVLRQHEGRPFISDNGNYIVDVQLNAIRDAVQLNAELNALPGVVETGLFPGAMVSQVIVGYEDGHTEVLER